jgi:hypothetical protein
MGEGRDMTANALEAADLQSKILIALFELCRDTSHVSARTLADAAGTTPTRAAACLLALERAGLCDASRARLTMLGLATVARLGAASGGGAQGKVRRLPPPRAEGPRRMPLAALPSQPPAPPTQPLPC